MNPAFSNLGIIVLGIVIGYALGEALEYIGKRTATVTGTIIVAVLNFSSTLLKTTSDFLPILGWGLFLGLFVSLFANLNKDESKSKT